MSVRSLREEADIFNRVRLRQPPRQLTPSVFVARGLIVRALRHAGLHHVLWREPCTFGLVGVPEGSVDAVTSAVRGILMAPLTANLGFDVTVYDQTDRRPKQKVDIGSVVLNAAKGADRACVLFSGHDAVSEAFLASAEGVVDLDPIDARILRGAFMRTVGKAPGRTGLDLVAALPIDLLDSVIVAGRSLERSLRVARKLLAAVENAKPNISNHEKPPVAKCDRGLRLEDLSGFGGAAEWGYDLARDLSDYRKGLLPWSDVDKGVLIAGPPGTGKTMFAQALARSCEVPIHLHFCTQWQAKGHLGDLLKAMAKAFEDARRASPCIIFLDEMDAFGSRDDPSDQYAAYAKRTIRVNCVLPGNIDTEMMDRFTDGDIQKAIDLEPVGRLGKPEEIAEAVLWMSDHLRQEKTGDLSSPLPEGSRQRDFSPGTIGLWGSGDFVIYYRGGRVPLPGIVILGKVLGDVSVFDRPGEVEVRLSRVEP